MKNIPSITIGVVLLLLFVTYMFTFQVRFNEAVYVTTFGKASDDSIIMGNSPDASGMFGNLHFKWPWPIQDVVSYDIREQIVQDRLEQIYTKGGTTIIVDSFLTWRITNPLEFSVALGNVDSARRQLVQRMRDAKSKVAEFEFNELTNPDPQKVKMGEAEQRMLDHLRADIAAQKQPWGVELVSLGFQRTILPQSVTEDVNKQMRDERSRIAQAALSEGESRKNTIIDDATNAKSTIITFAKKRAEDIRSEGRRGAVELYSAFADNPELARFLRTLNANRQALGPNATVILDANTAIGFNLWRPEYDDDTSAPKASDPVTDSE